MANKRHWGVVRKYLLDAANRSTTKKNNLGDILYIPEPFSLAQKAEIEQRRIARMEPFRAKATAGARKLMVLVGEVKGFSESRFGHKMLVKHLADYPFYMETALYKALEKRFNQELGLWDPDEKRYLIALATFEIAVSGIAHVVQISLILANENWIPFENLYDLELIGRLTNDRRRFSKALRYNLPTKAPVACAVLTDTPKATALYIQSSTDDKDIEALTTLIAESDKPSWLWSLSDPSVPELPAPGAAEQY